MNLVEHDKNPIFFNDSVSKITNESKTVDSLKYGWCAVVLAIVVSYGSSANAQRQIITKSISENRVVKKAISGSTISGTDH